MPNSRSPLLVVRKHKKAALSVVDNPAWQAPDHLALRTPGASIFMPKQEPLKAMIKQFQDVKHTNRELEKPPQWMFKPTHHLANSIIEGKLPTLGVPRLVGRSPQHHPNVNSLRQSVQRIKRINNNGGFQVTLNKLIHNSTVETTGVVRRLIHDDDSVTKVESRRLLGKSESKMEKVSNINLMLMLESS